MSRHVRRFTAKELEAILVRYGFELVGQKGSHRKWRHVELHSMVIVPDHSSRALPQGTIIQIMKAANIPDKEWRT